MHLKDNLLFMVVLAIVLNVAINVGDKFATGVPPDLFDNVDWWESVAQDALQGLGTGILTAVSYIAMTFGIELRNAKREGKSKENDGGA